MLPLGRSPIEKNVRQRRPENKVCRRNVVHGKSQLYITGKSSYFILNALRYTLL